MGSTDAQKPRNEAANHRAELGRYLRARREQLHPEDFGIARARRRRVQGLRRDEVAKLASVSPTWYTWLEQGRDIQVSVEVLDAVCRVLRLDDHASRYVRHLAGKPVSEPTTSAGVTDPAVESLIASLLPAPACAVTEAYDMLVWNRALAKVIGDPATVPPEQRNLVRMCFDNPTFRRRVSGWSAIAATAIAELRVVSALHPHSERLGQLIDQMTVSNPDFRQAWDALTVRPFFGEVVTIDLSGTDAVRVKVMELVLREESPITIVIFQPVDAESRTVLAGLVDTESEPSS
ncbi:helix-turn-helix transcriptional regulator [[Mycobacterium] burgundiense]|uniref:Helix-turn-helix transcriptional regulator n=1 Tax=[Mycobacterium] burgundiense TaxID=3064286 RepID=A0ABM9LKG9_9MYCO|nr:helix-turn-helix transcriptional regulator [Mycolicibacterium sp. MU0053]CAJ1500530.1 helix-turn-helix transcriptional regulator [Mycolicibacterium sp. MU0053]